MHWAVVAGKAGIGEKAGETVISGRQGARGNRPVRCEPVFFTGFLWKRPGLPSPSGAFPDETMHVNKQISVFGNRTSGQLAKGARGPGRHTPCAASHVG